MPEPYVNYPTAYQAFITKFSQSNKPIHDRFGSIMFDEETLDNYVDDETLIYFTKMCNWYEIDKVTAEVFIRAKFFYNLNKLAGKRLFDETWARWEGRPAIEFRDDTIEGWVWEDHFPGEGPSGSRILMWW